MSKVTRSTKARGGTKAKPKQTDDGDQLTLEDASNLPAKPQETSKAKDIVSITVSQDDVSKLIAMYKRWKVPVASFETLTAKQRRRYDDRAVYPSGLDPNGKEFCFEEIKYNSWLEGKQKEEQKTKTAMLEAEIEELRKALTALLKGRSDSQTNESDIIKQLLGTLPDKKTTPSTTDSSISRPLINFSEHRVEVVRELTQKIKILDTTGHVPQSSTESSPHISNRALSMVLGDLWNGTLAQCKATPESKETIPNRAGRPFMSSTMIHEIDRPKAQEQEEPEFEIFADPTTTNLLIPSEEDKPRAPLRPLEERGKGLFADEHEDEISPILAGQRGTQRIVSKKQDSTVEAQSPECGMNLEDDKTQFGMNCMREARGKKAMNGTIFLPGETTFFGGTHVTSTPAPEKGSKSKPRVKPRIAPKEPASQESVPQQSNLNEKEFDNQPLIVPKPQPRVTKIPVSADKVKSTLPVEAAPAEEEVMPPPKTPNSTQQRSTIQANNGTDTKQLTVRGQQGLSPIVETSRETFSSGKSYTSSSSSGASSGVNTATLSGLSHAHPLNQVPAVPQVGPVRSRGFGRPLVGTRLGAAKRK